MQPVNHERPFADRRREAGLTLFQAAIRLRISEDHLRRLERGRAPLSLRIAGKMAAEYGCTVQALTRPADFRAGGIGQIGRGLNGSGSRPQRDR
ncbi:MAG: helix-turn-helix domain-containing protein [Armatimonadota bacterium]